MAKNCRCSFLAVILKTVWLLLFRAWNWKKNNFDLQYVEVKACMCQAPILLQTCQLWSVLSALAGRGASKAGSGSPQ